MSVAISNEDVENESGSSSCCWFDCFVGAKRSNKVESMRVTNNTAVAGAAPQTPGDGDLSTPKKAARFNFVTTNGGSNLKNELTKSDKLIRSTLLIQRWYRRYKSRIEMRKLTAWNIYKSIEYSGEQTQLKLYDFFLTLIRNQSLLSGGSNAAESLIRRKASLENVSITNTSNNNFIVTGGGVGSGANGRGRKQSLFSVNTNIDPTFLLEPDESIIGSGLEPGNIGVINKIFETDAHAQDKRSIMSDIVVESSYKGVHLQLPITKQAFHDLVNSFKLNQTLHVKYVLMVLEEILKFYKKQKNITMISTNVTKNLTVVGDLHGQLDDLMMIFYKNGLPSDDNVYLFNGDFVDRGNKSIEISLIIFCGLLANPKSVYINRGNHEDYVMNARYGFLKEICDKYSSHSKRVKHLFDQIFAYLPLASLIDSRIYVVHGGISDKTSLEELSRIRRDKYVSILKPPILDEDGQLVKNITKSDLLEWRQVLDALWSDPKPTPGVEANLMRGGGCLWGADVSHAICKKYGFSLIIRSHECKESGYEYTHDDKVLTIFSASNYYESGSNNGAYVKIGSSKEKPVMVQYCVVKGKELTRTLSLRERVNAIESSAISHLLEKFAVNKHRLLTEYRSLDVENTGLISLNDWCKITGDVLELNLPWRTLHKKLVKMNENGDVFYHSAFIDSKIDSNLRRLNADENVAEALYRHKDTLESLFRAIDKDHSGQISLDEFRDCCRLIRQHDPSSTMTDQSIDEMAQTMDMNKDGYINLNEFLEAFRLASTDLIANLQSDMGARSSLYN